jgi:hypothetical protein
VFALWGIGLGGGYVMAADPFAVSPTWMHGARGFWSMSTIGLATAGIGLTAYLAARLRRDGAARARGAGGAAPLDRIAPAPLRSPPSESEGPARLGRFKRRAARRGSR